MKRILLACGTGICTSTAAANKLTKALNERGWEGKYKITQGKVAEAPSLSGNYDVCVATTNVPGEMKCPIIMGAPALLTGMGMDPVIQQVIDVLEQ